MTPRASPRRGRSAACAGLSRPRNIDTRHIEAGSTVGQGRIENEARDGGSQNDKGGNGLDVAGVNARKWLNYDLHFAK
jgi:hypothetical protein